MKKKNQKLTLSKEIISKLSETKITGGAKSGRGEGTWCDSVYKSCAETIHQKCPPIKVPIA